MLLANYCGQKFLSIQTYKPAISHSLDQTLAQIERYQLKIKETVSFCRKTLWSKRANED